VPGWGPGSLPRLRTWAREKALDIVNLQFPTAAYDMSPFVHILPDLLATPLICTFHDLRFPYLFPKAGPLRNWIVIRLARASAGIITTNQEDAALLESLPTRRRLIPIGSSVPHCASSPESRRRIRERVGAAADSFLLGHFGFLNPMKGVDHLLAALARLRAAGHDLRLLFIGARSNAIDKTAQARYQIKVEERIEQLGLADALHWTGFLPKAALADYFQAVDLMVLPFRDGASWRRSSLIAALHQGCAILTTEPAVEIACFQPGRNLWLAQRDSTAALTAALEYLLRERELLGRLRAGAAELSARFDWATIADDTLAFYEAVLAERRR